MVEGGVHDNLSSQDSTFISLSSPLKSRWRRQNLLKAEMCASGAHTVTHMGTTLWNDYVHCLKELNAHACSAARYGVR